MPDLAAGGAWTRVRLRWRRDPLTGASARILTGVKLQPTTRPDMTELTAKPAFCPFDSEYLETATVPFPAELTTEGRIRVGRAVVVPNIMAYATHSAVGIYDPGRHFLDLDELTPSLVGDALTAMVRHARAVRRLDPTAQWSSINANYLPPAGSSLVHPHVQSAHDAHGLTGPQTRTQPSPARRGQATRRVFSHRLRSPRPTATGRSLRRNRLPARTTEANPCPRRSRCRARFRYRGADREAEMHTADNAPSNVPMPRRRPDGAGASAPGETTGSNPIGFIQKSLSLKVAIDVERIERTRRLVR